MDEPVEIKNAISEPSAEEKRNLVAKAARKTIKEIVKFEGNPQDALSLAHRFASYMTDTEMLVPDDVFQMWRFPKELYGKESVSDKEWDWAATDDIDDKFTGFHNPRERAKGETALFEAQKGNYKKLKEFLEFEAQDNWGENKDMNRKLIELAKVIPDQGESIRPLKPAWLDSEIINYVEPAS